MHTVAHRGDPDGGRLGGVPRGVREQVVQDLHDALPVGHHAGQLRPQVYLDGMPHAAAQERVPGLIDQAGHR